MILCEDRACRETCGEISIAFMSEQPSAGMVRDFWRKSHTKHSFWKFWGSNFGDLVLHFWRNFRTKCWFWRFGASVLEDISYEMLVLETFHFCRKFYTKHSFWRFLEKISFWRFGVSLLEEVSYEILVFEI